MLARSSLFLVVFLVFCAIVTHEFTIPLPFGGLNINTDKDGGFNVDTNSNLNILGFGGHSGLNISAKDGKVAVKRGILVNGSDFGANSTFGFDKEKGIDANTDVNAGKQTFHGGLGKESQFANEVADAIKSDKTVN